MKNMARALVTVNFIHKSFAWFYRQIQLFLLKVYYSKMKLYLPLLVFHSLENYVGISQVSMLYCNS